MLMNKNSGPANGEAKLQYGPSGFRVLRGQPCLLCDERVPIPLDELRYWSSTVNLCQRAVATERLAP